MYLPCDVGKIINRSLAVPYPLGFRIDIAAVVNDVAAVVNDIAAVVNVERIRKNKNIRSKMVCHTAEKQNQQQTTRAPQTTPWRSGGP